MFLVMGQYKGRSKEVVSEHYTLTDAKRALSEYHNAVQWYNWALEIVEVASDADDYEEHA